MTNQLGVSTPIVVWVIEDDKELRSTVKQVLDSWSKLQCPLDFGSCEEALELLENYKHRAKPFDMPDVILLDVNLPGISGIQGIERIKELLPNTKIIMLTIEGDSNTIYSAFSAGASGYLIKNSSVDQIIDAVQQASEGGMLMPPTVATKVLAYFQKDKIPEVDFGLSLREIEVLKEMAEGQTQREIADRMFIAPATVNTHIQHIYQKLHVNCAPGAVAKAIRNNLI